MWPKKYKNIYDFLNSTYYLIKPFGLAPYQRQKSKEGNYIYREILSGKYLIPCCMLLLMSGSLVMATFAIVLYSNERAFIAYLVLWLYIYLTITATLSIFNFTFKSKQFLTACKLLDNVDKLFSMLKLNVNYTFVYFFTEFIKTLMPLLLGLSAVNNYCYKKADHFTFSYLNLSFGIPFVIIAFQLLYFYTIVSCVFYRFLAINTFLTEKRSKIENKLSEHNLLIVSDLHLKLCQICTYVTDTFFVGVLSIYLLAFTMLTGGLILFSGVYLGEVSNEIFFWSFFNTLILFLAITVVEGVKMQAKKIPLKLGQLAAPYFDSKLETRRDTLLLQILHHQEVNFMLGDFFEFGFSNLLGHFNTLITVLMFLLQINQNS